MPTDYNTTTVSVDNVHDNSVDSEVISSGGRENNRHDPGAHLYVMQAASGLIKVGRSSNPRQRAKALETASGQRIRVLFVLEGQGAREWSVHQELREYRTLGEWFRDRTDCRQTICELLGGAEIKWFYGEAGNLAKANAARFRTIEQRQRAQTEEAVANMIRGIEETGAKKRAREARFGP